MRRGRMLQKSCPRWLREVTGRGAGGQLVWGGECTLSSVPLGQSWCVGDGMGDGQPGVAVGGLVGDGG